MNIYDKNINILKHNNYSILFTKHYFHKKNDTLYVNVCSSLFISSIDGISVHLLILILESYNSIKLNRITVFFDIEFDRWIVTQ